MAMLVYRRVVILGTSSTEATRFIKALASEAEAVKAKVSVAHMARGLGLQRRRCGASIKSRQFIATKPPRSLQEVVKSKGIRHKMAETIRLRIYNKLPRLSTLPETHILSPEHGCLEDDCFLSFSFGILPIFKGKLLALGSVAILCDCLTWHRDCCSMKIMPKRHPGVHTSPQR